MNNYVNKRSITTIILSLSCAFSVWTIADYLLRPACADYLYIFYSLRLFVVVLAFCFAYWSVYKLVKEDLNESQDSDNTGLEQCNDENNRALLNDASSWAIHFSNVRLGIMAIAIPITIATVAVNIEHPKLVVWLSIWVLWLAAIFSFFALTFAQGKRLELRLRNLNGLGVNSTPGGKTIPERFLFDPHVWTVVALTIFLICATHYVYSGCLKTSQTCPPLERKFEGNIVGTPNTKTGTIDYKIDATVKEK